MIEALLKLEAQAKEESALVSDLKSVQDLKNKYLGPLLIAITGGIYLMLFTLTILNVRHGRKR